MQLRCRVYLAGCRNHRLQQWLQFFGLPPPPCPSSLVVGFIDMEMEEKSESASYESSDGESESNSEGGESGSDSEGGESGATMRAKSHGAIVKEESHQVRVRAKTHQARVRAAATGTRGAGRERRFL